MPRPSLFLAGSVCLAGGWLLALAAPASAQTDTPSTTTTGALIVRPLRVGSEDVKLGTIPVGIAECDVNADLEFELDGVPEDKSVDVYLGEACNQTTSRDTDTNSNCDYVGNFPGGQTRGLKVLIKTKQLIKNCDVAEESEPKMWFLAVSDPGNNEDVKTLYGVIPEDKKLRLDTRAPAAPTGVEGGKGEKQIPVMWDAPGSDLEGFIVLIDQRPTSGGGASGGGASGASGASGGGGSDDGDQDGGQAGTADGGQAAEPAATGGGSSADGECGSSTLTPNGSADDLPSGVKQKEVHEATATGIDLGPGDLGGGDIATVAVVAVDEAGNKSLISALVCVKIVPTESFWDRYQAEEGAVDGGCPCTALGAAQIGSAWPIALSLWFVARSARRRRRS